MKNDDYRKILCFALMIYASLAGGIRGQEKEPVIKGNARLISKR
jgi:hypothetical protein